MTFRFFATGFGRLVLGVAIFAAIFLVGWWFVTGWHPSRAHYVFQGVDVGQEQGEIRWPTIAAGGADFAYVRATMGTNGRDSRFASNWADVDAAGMRRGAVHIWSFCRPAADQANNFNTTVPRVDNALPAAVAIDFAPDCTARPDRATLLAELKRFATMVEAHTGTPILLKVAAPVESEYEISAGIDRPVWSMRNFLPPNYAARPWRMWQASDMRRIDGIDGPVHWDVVAP